MQANHDLPGSLLTLALAGIGLAILVLCMSTSVPASPSCLTKEEARAKWPRDHLYWHTRQRCWDNQRAVHGTAKPKGVVQSTEGSEEYKKPPRTRWASGARIRWQDYNEIDAMADRDQYFRTDAVALWPPLIERPPSALEQRFIPWEERINAARP